MSMRSRILVRLTVSSWCDLTSKLVLRSFCLDLPGEDGTTSTAAQSYSIGNKFGAHTKDRHQAKVSEHALPEKEPLSLRIP